jgi:hypothetical protein
MPAEKLSFLNGNHEPNSPRIPYDHLKVVWSPESPWSISSNQTEALDNTKNSQEPGWRNT